MDEWSNARFGVPIGFVCIALTVWFYFYQDEVTKRRLSVRSLLMLVLAIALGLNVGLSVGRLTIPNFP